MRVEVRVRVGVWWPFRVRVRVRVRGESYVRLPAQRGETRKVGLGYGDVVGLGRG